MASSPRFGLRLKLILSFALVATMAMLSAGHLAIRHSYQALRIQKQQDELSIARNIAVRIGGELAQARRAVEFLASQPDVASMDPARQRAALALANEVTSLIDAFAIADPAGRILLTDQPSSRAGRLLPASPYERLVRPVLASRTAAFSEVYISPSGEPATAISIPLLSGGRVVGVLSGIVSTMGHNLGGIKDIRIGKSGYAFVVDEKGHILFHPRPQRLLADSSSNPSVRELLARREGVMENVNYYGIPVLAAFAPVRAPPWGVIVRQPASESYAHADRLFYFLLLAFVGSLACATAAGATLAWRISKPVSALADGARAVAEGRLETRIPVTTRDELGDLAAAFNDMTARLRRTARSDKMAVVGQLAAGLAHEIHNPLNVIAGFSDYVLEKTAADDPRRQPLEDIQRETSRCQRLVAQLLDFARPKEPARAPLDLNWLAAETAGLLLVRARTQGVNIRVRPAKDLPRVEADCDQIQQVLLNLCLNACEAMPRGGTLDVRTRRRDNHVEVAVADDGPGIPPEDLRRLFAPFFTTKNGGTGLGLATSYSIVESHGGAIRADSAPGKGATFVVSLPLPGAEDA